MGYDVHITRKQNWFDDEPRISLGEWKSVVMSDDEMRLDGHAAATVGGGAILRVESEGLAVWTAHPQHDVDGNLAWFDYRVGNIVVKNPDAAILAKMWQLARMLQARVQGDDCEVYGPTGDIVS
ncbi:hypothetical protein [Paraburkholderia hospita]|uniref:hypothetical protein n=1 Tax=Paraburkholderia hospita TaxID=169430 RepID=UPI000311D475|nr:hypothetical protein [Paraburkholderia hospita]